VVERKALKHYLTPAPEGSLESQSSQRKREISVVKQNTKEALRALREKRIGTTKDHSVRIWACGCLLRSRGVVGSDFTCFGFVMRGHYDA
jgi:hypothetical protein